MCRHFFYNPPAFEGGAKTLEIDIFPHRIETLFWLSMSSALRASLISFATIILVCFDYAAYTQP